SYTLKDLWTKSTRTTTGSISASVPSHATVLYRVSPAGSGNTTRYEAESATVSAGGTIDSNHPGFSGTGFANGANAAGSYVEWTVNAAAAGPASLSFGYANGTTASRPVDISVNGTVVASGVTFPGTGDWAAWSTIAKSVSLSAGANKIRLTATTADGPANLDYVDVTPAG